MTTKPETLADLKALFLDGTALATSEEPSKKELKAFLERLDSAVECGGFYFTPENRAPWREYYDFLHAWHDTGESFPKKVVAHFNCTLRNLTLEVFDRTWDGFIFEALTNDPDTGFLDECLDELIAMTCPNACEEETPFICVPEHRQVVASLVLFGRINDLMGVTALKKLLEHVHVTRAIHGIQAVTICDEHIEFDAHGDAYLSL